MPAESPRPRPNGSSFAAGIFDFDETIIDLEPQHTAAHDALCRAMASPYDELPDSIRKASGRRIVDDIREMRAHFQWPQGEEELMELRQRVFDEECARADLQPLPGVREAIAALHAHGLPLAITSSSVKASIEIVLARLGLRDYFTVIVDGSEVANGKPDPEAYLLTARKLGVPPGRCIVFEDSEVGVLAAKGAGMYCVAIRNPRAQTVQDLSAADVVIS